MPYGNAVPFSSFSYTAGEYAGGYDQVDMTIPAGADTVEVKLYYQTTSREYIEFLRDEIEGYVRNPGNETLSGAGAYVVQTDPWFSQLRAWGDTIWQLWKHNMNVTTAAPYMMAQATVGGAPPTCNAPAPTLLTADPGNKTVTIAWSDESADAMVAGYKVYYDQAGKTVFLADKAGATNTTHTDTNLTNGNPYCYKVTSYYDATCESGFSNILCATPNATATAGVSDGDLLTGTYTGKGKTRTFTLQTSFARGDAVYIRAKVFVTGTTTPVTDAAVDITLTGPDATMPLTLIGNTDADGIAEVMWQTSTPNKKGVGGTALGTYTATVTNMSSATTAWDNVRTQTQFQIQ